MTLSKLEKLLPLVDELGLLPLLVKNKNLVLAAAPLLVEPAPALIPVVVNILRSSPSTFQIPGFALAAGGVFETVTDNAFLGIPLVLLSAPLIVLGSVLSAIGGDVPTVSTTSSASAAPRIASASRPVIAKAAPKVEVAASAPAIKVAAPAPQVAAPKIATSAPKVAAARAGGNLNGKRKTIKI